MAEQIEHRQSDAHRGFNIVLERAGASVIGQALTRAVEEQEHGHAGVTFSDESEEQGRHSSYVMSIRGGQVYFALYFSLPVSEVAEVLAASDSSPE